MTCPESGNAISCQFGWGSLEGDCPSIAHRADDLVHPSFLSAAALTPIRAPYWTVHAHCGYG